MTQRTITDPQMISFENDKIVLTATKALPPGSRVSFELEQPRVTDLHGKVINLTTDESGFRFLIFLHTLTKEQRQALSDFSR